MLRRSVCFTACKDWKDSKERCTEKCGVAGRRQFDESIYIWRQ
jgi:hypothetical protein